jgi:hypothetical protein
MTARWAGADNFQLLHLGTEQEVLKRSAEAITDEAMQSVISHFPLIDGDQRDATGLIANAQCSRNTTDCWQTVSLGTNKGEAHDGDASNTYFDIWKSGSLNSSMTQTLTDLPDGQYTLSALLRGTSGLNLTLKATRTALDGTSQEHTQSLQGTGTTVPSGSSYRNGWQKAELEPITIHHGDQLTITAETSSATTAWWSIDNFQLIYAPLPPEPDAITSIRQPRHSGTSLHTLDGRRTSTLSAPGIYIVRDGNGKARKVVVK